jgi:hypothetical protein
VPQLDGRGVLHLRGQGPGRGRSFTQIPLSVRAFADLVPQYAHTPDGVSYRRGEVQHSIA